jgi:Polyketide cyclase / dehydrase and lipid transport
MARYHFVTEFSVSADREVVWEALRDPTDWPSWWRWLKRVESLEEGRGPDGLGDRYRYAFGTALPYTLSFDMHITAVDRPRAIVGEASGELQGSGHWLLEAAAGGGTDVSYVWLVETTKRWMNVIAPIGRPAFSWNHDVLMRDFAKGVARITNSELQSVRNSTVRPGAPGFYVAPASTAG